ncbi:hypothetical protein E3T28_14510 [Cryobacterium sinapicolor]|uniref:O-antigen ligase domain-containing protein n=1 Tax=Cryobacterium sinapicolor TaxID=1259236 RepID=A0ABY2IWY5_9MICO|nr:hypothetical protein [Cryobacterium sinapicolor]TFC94703.1 hypothetical protein E3T28_14510 [Cryobacterium sinapicolor]
MSASEWKRGIFAPVGVAVAATAVGWQAASGVVGSVSFLVGVACLVALVVSPWVRAWAPYAAGVLFILLSASVFTTSTAVSVSLRVVGIGFLCLSGLVQVFGRSSFVTDKKMNAAALRSWLPSVVGSLLVFLLLAAAFHGQWIQFILYGFGLILLAIAVVVTAVAVPREIVTVSVIFALGFLVIASFVYGLTTPEVAVAGVRLRGLTPNANTLGFYTFLLGSLAMIVVPRLWTKLILLFFVGAVLLWTSSRASLLALAIVVFFVVLSRLSVTVVLAVLGAAGAAAVAAMVSPNALSILDGVFRGDKSRSVTLTGALDAFRSSPLVGIGLANEKSEIASSPLRALAYAGFGGLIAVLVIWVALIWHARTAGVQAVGFSLAAVVHSSFEGWLLSPVSPLLLIFVLVWWVIVRPAAVSHDGRAENLGSRTLSDSLAS